MVGQRSVGPIYHKEGRVSKSEFPGLAWLVDVSEVTVRQEGVVPGDEFTKLKSAVVEVNHPLLELVVADRVGLPLNPEPPQVSPRLIEGHLCELGSSLGHFLPLEDVGLAVQIERRLHS